MLSRLCYSVTTRSWEGSRSEEYQQITDERLRASPTGGREMAEAEPQKLKKDKACFFGSCWVVSKKVAVKSTTSARANTNSLMWPSPDVTDHGHTVGPGLTLSLNLQSRL